MAESLSSASRECTSKHVVATVRIVQISPEEGYAEKVNQPQTSDFIEVARQHWVSRWPETALSMVTATSIMRAQQIVLSTMDSVLRPFDLTWARYEALMLLSFAKNGSLPMGKMGERLMIHPTSVTSIVDRLSRDHLVERVRQPTDRRTVLAKITAEGRALADDATTAVNDVFFGVGTLSENEQGNLKELVHRLRVGHGDFATE